MRRAATAAAALSLLAAACAHEAAAPPPRARAPEPRAPAAEAPPAPAPVPAPPPQEPRPALRGQVGLASYYHRRLQGRRTANGERYDGRAFTCAHRTAPFGARLRVTELAGGRSVVVRVNDRGPFVRGRVIDVSLAAARELGIVKRGVVRVRVEVLDE